MLSSTRAMTCSNLWCSWVRRAVGLDSRALTTWRTTQQSWLSLAAEHSSIYLEEKISHLPGLRKLNERKGKLQRNNRGVSASLHASTPQKLFALHLFTKPTSALLFMPNSCHRVSGIYELLAAVCYQAEQAELGHENRQSGAIHRALWIRA